MEQKYQNGQNGHSHNGKSARSTHFGIEFAPLRIPLSRRLETGVVFYVGSGMLLGAFGFILLVWLLWTKYFYLSILYAAWIYYDRETPAKGGRLVDWSRRSLIWKYMANYYPITLEKTAELDPAQNYIFGYHPHGIFAHGAFTNFATDGTGFSKLFPEIKSYLVTLDVNFWLPIYRELCLARGIVGSSKESINWLLQKCGKGNAVVIVIGGAAESLDAVPNTMKLTLKDRKGFAKIALQNGASLVPVLSFGENEIFQQNDLDENSTFRKVQKKAKKWFRFTFPLFRGRGVFQYSVGLMPYRVPIHTIVGAPIQVTKTEQPTQEQIDELHQEYIQALTQLFKQNKDKYAKNPELELELK